MTPDRIKLFDALRALGFMGDLSMGQPIDHSPRVAWLSCRLAALATNSDAESSAIAQIALLRWAGCTSNAAEV